MGGMGDWKMTTNVKEGNLGKMLKMKSQVEAILDNTTYICD